MEKGAEFIQINEAITLINDRNESTYYLVCGNKKALMIDTGNGYDNVMEIAKTITELPIEVVNTHGHCDHVYGNRYCEEAWMHPNDFALCEEHYDFLKEKDPMSEVKCCPLIPIPKKKCFELGDLTLEVIELMGHTSGSIGLLDRKHRILFSGDAMNPFIWLQLEESLTLSQFRDNIVKMMKEYGDSFDYHLSGHTRALIQKQQIYDLLAGCDEILQGSYQTDPEYSWFGGGDKGHIYGDGDCKQICYNEKRIY